MNINFKDYKKNLITKLKNEGYIKSKNIELAFQKTPRENFIRKKDHHSAYDDNPLSIGFNQTISAPHMVAIICEELNLKKDQKILEIGSGSGYHAAIVSNIIGKKGKIFSIERIPALADFAKKNIRKTGIDNVEIIQGDGSLGLIKESPYDRIYITCAAPNIPKNLIKQLKDPGKLIVPVGKIFCILKSLEKSNGREIISNLGNCAFVPMIGKNGY
jgi:protein-L-isoaspartate(D-aspartate) O-methyltransferase